MEVYLSLIHISPSTGTVQQHKVNAVSHSDWRMGGLFFGNVPFNDVLHTLERVYGVKFHVRTSIYQNQSLRVHFNRNESLKQVLQIIKILVPGIESVSYTHLVCKGT